MNAENELGKSIKEKRKAMGLTQQQLAELANIDDKHLSKIENGIHLPTYNTLKKLSEVLSFNFQETENPTENIVINSPIYQKILKVVNTARSDSELQNYYDALKLAHKIMNSN